MAIWAIRRKLQGSGAGGIPYPWTGSSSPPGSPAPSTSPIAPSGQSLSLRFRSIRAGSHPTPPAVELALPPIISPPGAESRTGHFG
jgi:hypothetical protein